VRVIGPSSEEEMVALFLRTELTSTRFRPSVREVLTAERADERVVVEPRLDDAGDNALRRRLLGATRGYGRDEGLFAGFPADARWERVALSRSDLGRIRYIDYDYWVELSGGSRVAADGAANARAGAAPFGVSSDGFLELADALAAGARVPELILVTAGDGHRVVVLEGHARLTAYLVRPDAVPDEVEALLGTSEAFVGWGCY
jgi:hypothetical protein